MGIFIPIIYILKYPNKHSIDQISSIFPVTKTASPIQLPKTEQRTKRESKQTIILSKYTKSDEV